MKINLDKFLERLKELQGDGTVAALARRIGIRQNTFDLYIKGKRKPSVELVFSIIHNCGVSFEWLFGLSNDRSSSTTVVATTKAQSLQKVFTPKSSTHEVDLLDEVRKLKARVKALEDSSDHRSFACG